MSLLCIERLGLAFRHYHGVLGTRMVPVLENLDLTIARGEVLALIGASGAGKSLLAHALFGILPPNALVTGRIHFDGAPLDDLTRAMFLGRRMALMPQSISHLDPLVRCGRQLCWAAHRAGRPIDDAGAAAALARFGLGPQAGKAFPHQLSGGMARRMLMATATIAGPDLIVADEPTSGLDAENARVVLAHLRRLADEGRGVLLISHALDEALPFADRVALIDGGQMVGEERAAAFAGAGNGLTTAYARNLWHALPQNGFAGKEHA